MLGSGCGSLLADAPEFHLACPDALHAPRSHRPRLMDNVRSTRQLVQEIQGSPGVVTSGGHIRSSAAGCSVISRGRTGMPALMDIMPPPDVRFRNYSAMQHLSNA